MSKKIEIDIRFLIVALALVIVASVGSGFTAYLMFSQNNLNGDLVSAKDQREELGPSFDLGQFTVNIAGTTSIRFIRTEIVLELVDSDAEKMISQRVPQVRDRVIAVLRTYTLPELAAVDAQDKLRVSITNSINELFLEDKVVDLSFVDFVFQ